MTVDQSLELELERSDAGGATGQGSQFVGWGGEPGFTGVCNGDAVEFQIRDTFDDDYNLIERIDGVGDLYLSATATGTITDERIRATVKGTLHIGYGGLVACTAGDHMLELVRSGAR